MANEAKFPAAVFDTKKAVQWIKENADEYHFDPNSIGAIGGSAGAHLALLLGVSNGTDFLNPDREETDHRIYAELVAIPNAHHAFWNFTNWFEDVIDQAATFFHKTL